MSSLSLHALYDSKVQVASEMSIRELITAIGDSVSPISVMSRDSMIDIVALKLANDELRDGEWEKIFYVWLYLLFASLQLQGC